jgi:hypothetical protein
MIAVDISRSAAGGPVAGVPRQVFQHASNPCAQVRCFDIAPDGRFLLRDPKERQRVSVTQMDLILNWTSTLPK